MKIIICLVVFCAVTADSAKAQKLAASKVPSVVKSAFAKSNSGIAVIWEVEKGNYEAGYRKEGRLHSNIYTSDGRLLETEVAIEQENLPAPAWQYVKHTYKRSVTEVAKITKADGTVNYEAEVANLDLIFDAEGNFIRAERN